MVGVKPILLKKLSFNGALKGGHHSLRGSYSQCLSIVVASGKDLVVEFRAYAFW